MVDRPEYEGVVPPRAQQPTTDILRTEVQELEDAQW